MQRHADQRRQRGLVLERHEARSLELKMISGPKRVRAGCMSKNYLVRGQLSVVRSKDHICWAADWTSAPQQINNLLPTCRNIAPAHVCRFRAV